MKKPLYILYIPLLIAEWLLDMLVKIITVIHKSVEILTLAVESFINEPTRPANTAESNNNNKGGN